MSTPLKGLVIGRSAGRCAASDRGCPAIRASRRFAHPTEADPKAGPGRSDRLVFDQLDYHPDAWDEVRDRVLDDRLLCWWRTEVPEPGGRRNLFVDDETLVDLSPPRGRGDSSRAAFRFVLGLILLRRRKLRVVDRGRVGDEDIWRFKRVGGGDDAPIWSVADPRLAEDDAEAIAEQLSAILSDEG